MLRYSCVGSVCGSIKYGGNHFFPFLTLNRLILDLRCSSPRFDLGATQLKASNARYLKHV